jgi:hypothetical protein
MWISLLPSWRRMIGNLPAASIGLCTIELVRVDRALHHRLAQAVGAGDEDHVLEAGLGVDREHHARGAEVAAHHALHTGRQRHVGMREALVHPVRDGAVVVERREHMPHAIEHRLDARARSGRFPADRRTMRRAGLRRSPTSAPRPRSRRRIPRPGGCSARGSPASSCGRQRALLDQPLADLGAAGGQCLDVLGVQALRGDRRSARSGRLNVRKSRKACAVVANPPGTRTPEACELADQFTRAKHSCRRPYSTSVMRKASKGTTKRPSRWFMMKKS